MPEPIHLDVFVHERQALATLPRWAAEQAGLIKQRAGADQPGLFEGR